MMGAWAESWMGTGEYDAEATGISRNGLSPIPVPRRCRLSPGSTPSPQRSLPGVTFLVDEQGEPLTEVDPACSREHLSTAGSSAGRAPHLDTSPALRLGAAMAGPEIFCIYTPSGAVPTPSTGSVQPCRGASMRSPDRGFRSSAEHSLPTAALESASSSPSFAGGQFDTPPARRHVACVEQPLPGGAQATGGAAANSTPESSRTRRALWKTLDAAGTACPMVDWSMPSSSSWVGMSSARPVTSQSPYKTGTPFLQSPSPRKRDVSLTPQSRRGGDLTESWPMTPQLQGVRSSPFARGHLRQTPSSPDVAGESSLLHTLPAREPSPPAAWQTHSAARPQQLPGQSSIEAFRAALQGAQGLDSDLRQDLLSLVDRFDPKGGASAVGISGIAGIPVVDHWDGTQTPRGSQSKAASASPTQSDVEAALQTMKTPPDSPWAATQTHHSSDLNAASVHERLHMATSTTLDFSFASADDDNCLEVAEVRERNLDDFLMSSLSDGREQHPHQAYSLSLGSRPSCYSSPAAALSPCSSQFDESLHFIDGGGNKCYSPEELYPSAVSPVTPHQQPSAMWLYAVPPIPGVEVLTPASQMGRPVGRPEALTPAAPTGTGRLQHRAQPLASSLAAARDQFKMSIGARERSRQFANSLAGDLLTLASSPIKG